MKKLKQKEIYQLLCSHLEVGGPRGLRCSNGKKIIQASLYESDFSGIRRIKKIRQSWGDIEKERIIRMDAPVGSPELPAGFFWIA